MRKLNARYAIATLAIGGFAAGTAFFGAGVATADLLDDLDPLLTTTCTWDQIDAALHEVAPESAARLDASPFQKAVLELTFEQPTDKRVEMFEQLSAQRQRMGVGTGLKAGEGLIKSEVGTVLHKVGESCHKY